MAKNLKINIKNTQIAEAINLGSLKSKLAKKKEGLEAEAKSASAGSSTDSSGVSAEAAPSKPLAEQVEHASKSSSGKDNKSAPQVAAANPVAEEAPPRIKARTKSAFAEGAEPKPKIISPSETVETEPEDDHGIRKGKTSEELRKEIFGEEIAEQQEQKKTEELKPKAKTWLEESPATEAPPVIQAAPSFSTSTPKEETKVEIPAKPEFTNVEPRRPEARPVLRSGGEPSRHFSSLPVQTVNAPTAQTQPHVKLGPTGKHMRDLLPPPRPAPKPRMETRPAHLSDSRGPRTAPLKPLTPEEAEIAAAKAKARARKEGDAPATTPSDEGAKGKPAKFKEFRDIKPQRKGATDNRFDVRDRQGLRETDDDKPWRKRRGLKMRPVEDVTIRPTSLKVRLPITIKDLAVEMKLKSSQLIQKLFMQGVVATLNDMLEDETTIQLLGQEFGCEIGIDTTEEARLRITDKSIKEEVANSAEDELVVRPPVVAFMGHVDHGKTSLIDYIRTSNRAAGEAGAITQHIGAFRCSTAVGDIAILDTPGHEAFSAMRARGADVTDIVVLVVAGDEGLRVQTLEAIQHARQAGVTIVVAINKSDKPNFNAENVYRQLAEQNLLPEAWGGAIITVNCSAVTGEGIPQLLEMLALQAEVLELKANPQMRARGSVLESEMHKGMGSVATVLVQNGTLRIGDPLVFGELWGRVKTMRNEYGIELEEAGPSTPVEITGLSGLPEAGQDFIVVKSEREAREIAEDRHQGQRQTNLMQKKKVSMENLMQQAQEPIKKILNIILRADVQGSLEALKTALEKIESKKAELNIIFAGVGEIGESDVQLAAASKAVILGFHTAVESHAESFVKQLAVQVRQHDIIYHAIDDIKVIMVNLLDKIAIETDKGKALVKAVFKSSHVGLIAGCQVTEGTITRNNQIRLKRNDEVVWKGGMSSLKRVKEDVREVQKGFECGILLNGTFDVKENDVIEAYEITYITQEL